MAPHFLLLPLPEYGHITSMLNLASHLAALGSKVTFVRADKAPLAIAGVANKQNVKPGNGELADDYSSLSQTEEAPLPFEDSGANEVKSLPSTENLYFRTLPWTGEPSFLTEQSSRFDILRETLDGLLKRQKMVEKMIQDSRSTEAPIACVICDVLLCNWVMPLATRHEVLPVAFLPCSFVNFYLPYLMKIEKYQELAQLRLSLGFPVDNSKKAGERAGDKRDTVRQVFFNAFANFEMASHTLVNSWEGLEGDILDVMQTLTPKVQFIGPCLPVWEVSDAGRCIEDSRITNALGCPFMEDTVCLHWLDGQEKNSVLLISFGSEVYPSEEQVQELAMGIEASGCKFLWVVRPGMHMPSKDFLDRTHEMGFCVSWIPQRRVLKHSAVGCFLTHCGWNSQLKAFCTVYPFYVCLLMETSS
ncbi:hypothetical protein KP509_06G061900 [Ceratopteris richardii]|uniref:Glycosyltransferase n=2 Tax=Ceratopteris richardii TaxID=49495 RepID=A0A8T2UKV1_CERRI|nr:hypothetical protein KP509_06G061900 [Ceratopteris richardii]